MAKKTTRAEIILNGARERVRRAQELVAREQDNVDEAEGELKLANAVLTTYQSSLEQLEKDLAITPRKKSGPKSPAPSAGQKSGRRSTKDQSAASTEGDKGSAGSVALLPDNPETACAVPNCGKPFTDFIHNQLSEHFHVFHAEIKTKKAAA